MRRIIIGAALATVFASSVAFAAQVQATITHIDVNARIIVVDGRAFHLGNTINIGAFKVGEKVTIVYEINNGQLRIVTIKVS